MRIIWRGLVSLIYGGILYSALLFAIFRFHPPFWVTRMMSWNVIVFSFLGRGEPIGYMPNGAPVYDGSVGFLGVSYASILTGFVIYPILIFILISVLGWRRRQLD